MELKKIWNSVRRTWDWVWHSDSFLSWLVALLIIFIFVKYIFFPVLGFIMGTSLPLAGVESSSMDHQIVKDDYKRLILCGNVYSKEEIERIDFNEYWEICGDWYENKNITKKEFSKFPLKNGFRKGDILIVWGWSKIKKGDIIIFKPNKESIAPRPIVHRIVEIKENFEKVKKSKFSKKNFAEISFGNRTYAKFSKEKIEENQTNKIYSTKGDHNQEQLTGSNNNYNTDETNIKEEQIVGEVIFKIPFLGWLKIWFIELIQRFK